MFITGLTEAKVVFNIIMYLNSRTNNNKFNMFLFGNNPNEVTINSNLSENTDFENSKAEPSKQIVLIKSALKIITRVGLNSAEDKWVQPFQRLGLRPTYAPDLSTQPSTSNTLYILDPPGTSNTNFHTHLQTLENIPPEQLQHLFYISHDDLQSLSKISPAEFQELNNKSLTQLDNDLQKINAFVDPIIERNEIKQYNWENWGMNETLIRMYT